MYRVVLDANVLYPASLRDLLLRCAEKELYRLQLSQDIWTECHAAHESVTAGLPRSPSR